MDAPVHFSEGKQTVDEVPVEHLIDPGIVIDITTGATNDPDYVLTLADVQTWETKHGAIPARSMVILRTG
jgi:kynurenine formamidase